MTAIEYLKAKVRMTNKCSIKCDDCPLSYENNEFGEPCRILERNYPEKSIEIVEKWAKEHPIKTRQSELLKICPNTNTDENGLLMLCPKVFEPTLSPNYCTRMRCDECRKEYWLEETE